MNIAKGFWLGQTEVTVAAYRRFAEQNKRTLPNPPLIDRQYWDKEEHPMINVSWRDASDFCNWAGGRLPSEAEWEYAARGGLDGKIYAWGDVKPVCQRSRKNGANFDLCDESGPLPVRSYQPNDYKLYDMAGNVWELIEDEWHDSYHRAPDDGRAWPKGKNPDLRVFRGGSWSANIANLRVATRSKVAIDHRNNNIGFRCAVDPKEPEKPEAPDVANAGGS